MPCVLLYVLNYNVKLITHDGLACPNTANPVQKMEKLLSERIFGQDEAIKMIITAFRAHDKTKPLTFHFAGGMKWEGETNF
jgi:hypothetical protein